MLTPYISADIIKRIETINTIGVHNETMHLDEIAAIALLKICGFNGTITRSRDEEVLNSLDCLIDVGLIHNPDLLKFDHHQIKGGTVSSAGLIWQWLGLDLLGHSIFRKTNNFILAVDAQDCGVKQMGQHSIAMLIGTMNKSDLSSKKQEDSFFFAIDVVIEYLSGLLTQDIQIVDAKNKIDAAERVITASGALALKFDEYCNGWNDYVHSDGIGDLSKVSRVIWYNKPQNNWKVQVPGVKKGSFDLNGEKIKPDDKAIFVHDKGFIAVFKTLEDLISCV